MTGESTTGFQFGEDRRADGCDRIIEDYRVRRAPSRSHPVARAVSRPFAGVLAFVLAQFSGMAIANSTMIETVTVDGQQAIIGNGFDAEFLWALGLGFVAMLIIGLLAFRGDAR